MRQGPVPREASRSVASAMAGSSSPPASVACNCERCSRSSFSSPEKEAAIRGSASAVRMAIWRSPTRLAGVLLRSAEGAGEARFPVWLDRLHPGACIEDHDDGGSLMDNAVEGGPRQREQDEREDEQVEEQREQIPQSLKKRPTAVLLQNPLPKHERRNRERPPAYLQQVEQDDGRSEGGEAECPEVQEAHGAGRGMARAAFIGGSCHRAAPAARDLRRERRCSPGRMPCRACGSVRKGCGRSLAFPAGNVRAARNPR